MLFDTIIKNVEVFDGTGEQSFCADVAILEGKIAEIGQIDHEDCGQLVEGAGLALAPGFIDVHTHDDTNVIRYPDCLPKISQGVTTVIVGNCGISASPTVLAGDPPDPIDRKSTRLNSSHAT